jgi:YD repeat-containing protein
MTRLKTIGTVCAIGLLALASASTQAEPLWASSRMSGAAPKEREQPVDMAAVRRRTAEYEAARKRHEVELARPTGALQAAALMEKAQVEVGPRPGILGRFAFPPVPDEAKRAELGLAHQELREALRLLHQDAETAIRRLSAVEQQLEGKADNAAVKARLRAKQREIASRYLEMQDTAAAAAGGLAARAGGFIDRFREFQSQFLWEDGPTNLARARAMLARYQAVREASILGAELTYIQGGLGAGRLSEARTTPAYLAANGPVMPLEDTTVGREVELSDEVRAQANALSNVVAIYNFVKNDFKLDWYYGLLKGSTATLREKRGNDADLAALFIALLRAKEIPARYVRGTIELPIGRMCELMALLNAAQVDALHGSASSFEVPDSIRTKALAGLTATGIPYQPVLSGGRIGGVKISHIWVEAYIPYADYRGSGNSAEGRQWVAIDPAITGGAKYAASEPALDVLVAMSTSAAALTDSYLAEPRSQTPLEFYRARVQSFLAQSHPELTYDQVQRTVQQRAERHSLLPGSLPYDVVSVQDELPFLPEQAQHRVHLTVSDATGVALDVTVPTYSLIGHRTVLTYEAATAADAQIIQSAGGLYRAPAAAVAVVPVLRVDGLEKALGARAIGLGLEQDWSFELLLPNGSRRSIQNRIIAGNLVAIGVGGPKNLYVEPVTPLVGDLDGPAPRFLFERAVAYANAWTDSEEELMKLLQVAPIRPTANVVFVENQLAVDSVLGVPQQVRWKGLEIDADLRTMTGLELVAGRAADFLRLSGHEGSILEAKVLFDGTHERSVSAVNVIQEAHSQEVEVLRLDASNFASAGSGLQSSAAVLREVQDQVGLGREVLIPKTDLTIENWRGTGFISRDLQTGEAGYFLSGVVSGGQTVISPAEWADQSFVDQLTQPDAPKAVKDPSQARLIVKVLETDFQSAVGGTAANAPLRVLVLTAAGQPVEGAKVTFYRMNESMPALAPDANGMAALLVGAPADVIRRVRAASSPVTVATDSYGQASVVAAPFPGPDLFVLQKLSADARYEQSIGWNTIGARVDVTTGTGIVLADPFTLTGQPGEVARNSDPPTVLSEIGPGLEYTQWLESWAKDKFGVPVANQTVVWSSTPAGHFIDEGLAAANGTAVGTQRYDVRDPAQVEVLRLVSATDGQTSVRYIPSPAASGSISVRAAVGAVQVGAFIGNAHAPGAKDCVVSMVRTSPTTIRSGIKGTTSPQRYVVTLFRLADGEWVPIGGKEQDIASAKIHLSTWDSKGRSLGAEQSLSPMPPDSSANRLDPGLFYSDQFLATDDFQTTRVGGTVTWASGETRQCLNRVDAAAYSGVPTIKVRRVVRGGEWADADSCGTVSKDDEALLLEIYNPASYEVYARIDQTPNDPASPVVRIPGADVLRRHPADPELIAIDARALYYPTLGIVRGTAGGIVRLKLLAQSGQASDPKQLKLVASQTAQVSALSNQLEARVVYPLRNAGSGNLGPGSAATASADGVAPFLFPGTFEFCVAGTGSFRVLAGGNLVSEGRVAVAEDGTTILQASSGTTPLVVGPKVLQVGLRPANASTQEVVLQQTPDGGAMQESKTQLVTVSDDAAALPVGHLFVKDVSVVDGHVARQFEDLRIQGRGALGGLSFTRSYTSGGFSAGPMGPGWTHNFRSFLLANQILALDGTPMPATRYMVVGGEGTGQVFLCSADLAGSSWASVTCTPQRGYHGSLRAEQDGTFVFRSKAGVEYRYGATYVAQGQGYCTQASREAGACTGAVYDLPRRRLMSVTDPVGNRVVLKYNDLDLDAAGEVAEVREPVGSGGAERYLAFSYRQEFNVIDAGEVARGRGRLVSVQAKIGNDAIASPVTFQYDGYGRLVSATRDVRTEKYSYLESDQRYARNNLAAYTDPNGNQTQYEYFARTDTLFGMSAYQYLGPPDERVHVVREGILATTPDGLPPICGADAGHPCGGVTRFEYAFQNRQLSQYSAVLSQTTSVYGPRPDVADPAVYRLDPYGGALTVERPLAPSWSAVTVTRWDLAHQTKEWETDTRGRRVSFGYDASGNLTSRRIALGRLSASGDDRQGTDDVLDAAGNAVGESVELWAHEPSFNQVICHADANRYVTWNSIDSSTGKLLKTTRYANRSSSRTCSRPSGAVGSEVSYEYCGINGACPPGAVKGDLVRTVDATGATEILALDGYGNPQRSRRSTSGTGWVTTTFTYDARSRLVGESDTLGHSTTWTPNELDQIEMVVRGNTKGASPGLTETRHYYPGGQVRDFSNALGLSKQFALDAANRTIKTVETGPGLAGALESRAVFDEAGNKVSATDRRGATVETVYAWGNRPRTQIARVLAGDLARYSAQRGEPTFGPITLATFGYDDIGNKVFATDVHGHRTDYVLDALYRAARVLSPPVPSATVGDGSQVSYTTTRRYDLNGNKIYEEDGNHHATSWSYDYANRLALTVDAAGRYESRGYDGNGNLVAQENGATGPTLARVATLKRIWDAYDGLNRPTALNEMVPSGTSELLYGSRWVYDDSAHAVYQRDRRGYVTTARLDDLDRVFEQVVDDQPGVLARAPDDAVAGATAVAAKTSFEYDGAGNRKATVDALGRRTGDTFDALNRVAARSLPMGVGETFAYDGEGHLIQHTDRRGIQARSTLDLLARATKEELAEAITNGGAWLAMRSVVYDDANAKVTETDALNRSVTRFLDGMHRETRREEPLSRVVETRYDAAVKRGYRDEGLFHTTWAYDAANRPTQTVEVDGATEKAKYTRRFEYHDDQLEELAYDRNGTLTTRTYDGLHRVIKSVRGDADAIASEETAYDGAGNPTRTTSYGAPSTRQRVTERHFDGANRKVSETLGVGAPEQATTAYAYDAVGNRVRMKGPRTSSAFDLRETYDALNRTVRSEDALGNVTTRAYDQAGNKLCEVRPLGMPALQDGKAGGLDVNGIIGQVCPAGSRYTTRWQYDEVNKLIGSTDALGGTYAFVYDRVRNLVAKLNPNQGLLTYEFDALNRRTYERQHFDRHASISRDSVPGEETPVDPVAGSGTASWHTEYDADGNPWRVTDPKHQVTVSTYEVGNRLKRQEFSSPFARELPALNSIDYAYDGNGNLTGRTRRRRRVRGLSRARRCGCSTRWIGSSRRLAMGERSSTPMTRWVTGRA